MGIKIVKLKLYQYIVAIMPKEMIWFAFNRFVNKVTEDRWTTDIPGYELTIKEAVNRWLTMNRRNPPAQ